MTQLDEECKHGMLLGTCSICSGKDASRTVERSRGGSGPQSLDSPESLEKYRSRYPGDREPTFDAYVEVFFRLSGAREFPGGWTNFSRCANGEPALVQNEPGLVHRAEELMRLAGYQADDSGRPAKGRRWVKIR